MTYRRKLLACVLTTRAFAMYIKLIAKALVDKTQAKTSAVKFPGDENQHERAPFALTNQHMKVCSFPELYRLSGERALPFETPA